MPLGEALRLLGVRTDDIAQFAGEEPSSAQSDGGATSSATEEPVWLIVAEAAIRARCSEKTIYREVKARRLRAARVGGRRELRFRGAWIDEWLDRSSQPVEVTPAER